MGLEKKPQTLFKELRQQFQVLEISLALSVVKPKLQGLSTADGYFQTCVTEEERAQLPDALLSQQKQRCCESE